MLPETTKDDDLSASTSNLPPLQQLPVPARAKSIPAWKNEVSARVRAHRTGFSQNPEQPMLPGMEPETPAPATNTAERIAARVAARYARVPSWRETMAAEAAAQAAAPPPAPKPPARPAAPRRTRTVAKPAQEVPSAPLLDTVAVPAPLEGSRRAWQPELLRYSVSADSLPSPRSTPAEARALALPHAALGLDLLSDPLEEATVEPTLLLPARVLEFPRELIAPRKARPRLAEGPLGDDAPRGSAEPVPAQPAAASTGLAEPRLHQTETESTAGLPTKPRIRPQTVPEWHSIQLDSEEPVREPQSAAMSPFLGEALLHVAPVGDRLMAAVVDVALTLAAFLLFILVFAACSTHAPSGKIALAGAGITLLVMGVLYQVIFFSLSAATPGMRYAHIALCTFDDENPSRRTMRVRIAALLLSALPLGLGFLWAVFDEDALSWHDRITQTYQRSYREA